MDNLTHTLIGTLLGETATRAVPLDPRGLPRDLRRNLIVTLAAVGSNLPDLDLAYSYFGSKVNYLLHHRGHTHTILGALALAAIAYILTMAWLKRRAPPQAPGDRALIGATLGLSALLHLAMDATNNYGVHPFWPFDMRWYYGDAVFIIEPLLWAAAAPLVFLLRTPAARVIVAGILALGVALGFTSGFVPIAAAVALTSITIAMLLLANRAKPRVALLAGITLWMLVTASFIFGSRFAALRTDELAARTFPQARLLDRVLTPMPANPLCWEIVLVQEEGANLVLRRAMLALAPEWIPATGCLSRNLERGTTARLAPVEAGDEAGLKWYGEIATPIEQLRSAADTHCEARAALHFIRAPWIARADSASVLGDLRYDREEELGFAELSLDEPMHCPPFVPSWRPPRADVLQKMPARE